MGVERVRLYHDNGLCPRSSAPDGHPGTTTRTIPLDSPDVVTVWIPLQPTSQEMGPLAFARGAGTWQLVADIEFDKHGTSYDRRVSEIFRDRGVVVEDGPVAAGEISFHSAHCFHTAGANRTTSARMVLATTYLRDGVRVVPAPTMVSGDWQKFIPGAAPGEVVAT
jgi:ectoine hydroxylase-related dioxygenase (phytanoyl-CoA dioxygenase family)